MSSTTTQGPPGGSAAARRLHAVAAAIRTGAGDGLGVSLLSLQAEELGPILANLRASKARIEALELRLVAKGEECDVARTTGAVNTSGWLRNAQRMSKTEAAAAVGLARDLDRTVLVTAAALARGELSFRHAQVIAFAVKDLPSYVCAEQLREAEEFLVDEARRRNPDEIRLLGRALLQTLAPEEYEARIGKKLSDEERKAERKRSLRFIANGIPQS